MTVSSTTSRVSYTGNGAVDTYAYTFRIFDEADLLVVVRDTDDVETELALTTDYTVTGVGDLAGGTVVLVNSAQAWLDGDGDLKSGYIISIRRVRTLTQETDIRNQGDFFPETHEDTYDHLLMVDQQQQDEIDRSIKLPESADPADFDLRLPASIIGAVNQVIMTNDTGDGFEPGPTAANIAAADAILASASAEADAAAASAVAADASADAAAASAASIALTTKGDILTRNASANTRLGVGSNRTFLMANSNAAEGVTWSDVLDDSYMIKNLALTATVGSNALTIAIKNKAGNDPTAIDPVEVGFRSSTLSLGTFVKRSITAALTVTISSGSTLGHASAYAHYFYVYLIDNAGTPELAVSTSYYEDHSIISTTAEGGAGAADSNATIYSTTARSNVGIRLIGRMLSTQTTAGTWAAVPSEIKLMPFYEIVPSACYTSSVGHNINSGSVTFIDYETKVWDTHNAVLGAGSGKQTTYTSTFRYVAPKDGKYAVTAASLFDSAVFNATTALKMAIAINGTEHYAAARNIEATYTDSQFLPTISTEVALTAGQALSVSVYHDQGAARSLVADSAYQRFTITKVA